MPETKEIRKPKDIQPRDKFYKFTKGDEIKAVFVDGKAMTGVVHQFSQYHIVLEFQDKNELVTVFKHTIKYIVSKKPKETIREEQ